MELSRFEQLVNRLETRAAEQPKGYKIKVWLLAMMGYAYLFLILLLLVGVLGIFSYAIATGHGNLLFVKLGIPVLIVAYVVLKSMWVKIPEPKGIQIDRQQATKLFQLLDKLQKQLKSVRVHEVVMTGEFNASVVQVPRLGIFGWQKNYLILGLPLMEALSESQFRAVLAHELGHLSGKHSRFAAWIYRVRRTWGQIMEELETKNASGSFLFRRFLNWYAPFLNAFSFALARSNEYEADRCAARLTDSRTAAESLTAVHVFGDYMNDKFWPTIYQRADHVPVPVQAFHDLGNTLRQGIDRYDAETALQRVLARETNLSDTHPCLQERLAALGESPQLPVPFAYSAMEALLPEARLALTNRFEEQWQKGIREEWKKRYNEMQNKRNKLEQLESKQSTVPLEESELWQKAELMEEVGRIEEAALLYKQITETNSSHVSAMFAVGRIKLDQGLEEGIAFLQRSMELNADATGPACKLIIHYLLKHDRKNEAEQYWNRSLEWQHKNELSQQERSRIKVTDPFLPHDLNPEEWEKLKQLLANYPHVRSACLVRKQVAHYPEKPLYIMLVLLKGVKSEKCQAYLQNIIDEIEINRDIVLINVNQTTKFKSVMKKHSEGRLVS
ncbi:MAG: hypothetical protein K0R57_1210 [Paenibacillaceae bacterium]|nr:hypothetical protein [Paenibacillaceae bacterium]